MTVLLVARPLYPSESAAAQGDGLPVVMLWLAIVVIWLVGAIGRKRITLCFGPVDTAVLLLVAWQCVAAVHAVRYGSPRPALNMLWEWVGFGIVFFLARQLVRSACEVRAVVAAMIALMAAISVYGIYQRVVELPAMERRYEADKDAMLHEAGLSYPSGTPLRDLLEKRLANPEPLATFALTNSLAAALAPWLVVSLAITVATRRDRKRWIAWLVCTVPIAVCLLLTKSRSGYVAVAVGIIWLVQSGLRENRKRWLPTGPRARLVGAAVLIGLLATLTMVAVFERPALAKAATSFGYRLEYWQSTVRMIVDRPLLGCGPGNFQDLYTQYKLPGASEEVTDPHNFLLDVWATAGTPALLALLAVFGFFAKRLYGTRESSAAATDSSNAAASLKLPTCEDDWRPVFAGAIGGLLLSIPLGQISAAPPSSTAYLIILPAAVVGLALLVPWVRNGTFSPALAGVATGVLLVDLLTTGGIGIPGIAQSLWLFLVLGLDGAWPREVPRTVTAVLLVVGLGLSAACYGTSYARVLPCQGFLRLARHEYLDGHRQATLEVLRRAVDADPISSDAHSFLAEIYLDLWLTNHESADYEAFETEDALARQTAPAATPIWRASTDRYRRAFAETDSQGRHLQPQAIEIAVETARRTAELYPGSGIDRAYLAIVYQLVGDESSYRREARIALELDRQMSHDDKKLPEKLRRQLESAVASPTKNR